MPTPFEHEQHKKYERDSSGFWRAQDSKQKIGHEEDCKETYESLSALFQVFSEIDISN